MESKRVQVESFWTKRSAWLSFAVVVLVSAVGFLFDLIILHEGVSRRSTLVLSNTLTGLVAGGLFFYITKREKAHRELMRERVKTVAELNHHIRNALQVIAFCGAEPGLSGAAKLSPLQLIKESVDRIEWALREVLPRYPVAEHEIKRLPPIGYGIAASATSSRIGAFSEPGIETERAEHSRYT